MDIIELLKIDYDKTLATVDKFDEQLFKIRAWALTTCSATIVFAVSEDEKTILLGTIFLCICFYFLELVTKSFHEDCIKKCIKLEEYLQYSLNTNFKVPDDYEFGLGHAIKEIKASKLKLIFLNKNRWHIRIIYWGIIILSVIAYSYIQDLFK